jgi:hypothetical protein
MEQVMTCSAQTDELIVCIFPRGPVQDVQPVMHMQSAPRCSVINYATSSAFEQVSNQDLGATKMPLAARQQLFIRKFCLVTPE